MTEVLSAVGAAAALALIVSFIKGFDSKIGAVLSAAVALFLVFFIVRQASGIKEGLDAIGGGRISEYLPYILKSVGIGFFAETCCDICADAGEKAAASKIMTAGKLGILAVCLPLVKKILDTAIGYLT